MKTFAEFLDDDAEVDLVPVDPTVAPPRDAIGRVSIWREGDGASRCALLLEAIGNKTVHLTGQYWVRYDPPRDASTGRGAARKGDWHLMNGSGEIAAWDSNAKARHEFAGGTRIPKKAFKALQAKYGALTGLKGPVLESILEARRPELSTSDSVDELLHELLAQHPDLAAADRLCEHVADLLTRAALAEREACARIADDLPPTESANREDLTEGQTGAIMGMKAMGNTIALAIRARTSGG